jgi:hypothetical protein
MEIHLGGDMPTHSRKHSDATQITAEILKEAARPRQAASVKEAFEKKNPASVAPKTLGGNKVGKSRAAKASVSR